MAGVSILLKETSIGTVTDAAGKFSLTVPDAGGVLVISNSGYSTQEVAIGNQQSLNLELVRTSLNLDEVVVIGYGTQKKKR